MEAGESAEPGTASRTGDRNRRSDSAPAKCAEANTGSTNLASSLVTVVSPMIGTGTRKGNVILSSIVSPALRKVALCLMCLLSLRLNDLGASL